MDLEPEWKTLYWYGVMWWLEKFCCYRIMGGVREAVQRESDDTVFGYYINDLERYGVVDYVESLKPSARGELEITDLNRAYLVNNDLYV